MISSGFCRNDIYNEYEFALYYTSASTSTIGSAPLPGRKVSKERVTILAFANVDSTDNVPPLVVGKARRPQCFHGLSAAEHGFAYDSSGKGWMNTIAFNRWLERFDSHIGRNPERKVLLFIDNASAHRRLENLPTLNNVRIEFLPKRTTPILQALDMGMIACAKRRYVRKVTQRAVDLIDNGVTEGLYRINIKRAALWLTEIWSNIENDKVYNCWTKTTIV